MELWQAIVLGLVEGITEYLPVSSTGHLILVEALLGVGRDGASREAVKAFSIIVQGGAIAAVAGLYWPRCVQMLRGVLGRDADGLRLVGLLLTGFLPAAALGVALKPYIDRYLFRPAPVALALAVGGVYMIVVDRWRRRNRPTPAVELSATGEDSLGDGSAKRAGRPGEPEQQEPPEPERDPLRTLTFRQALFIGVLQCASLWPGVSRSMMTITGGYLVRLPVKAAAEFSFLLGMVTLVAATGYELLKNLKNAHDTGGPNVFQQLGVASSVVGIAVAALSAALAVRWLVGFLTRRGLTPFGYYRLALAAVVIAFFAWR